MITGVRILGSILPAFIPVSSVLFNAVYIEYSNARRSIAA